MDDKTYFILLDKCNRATENLQDVTQICGAIDLVLNFVHPDDD